MPLLSPIIDGFLNDHNSPEELAEQHQISVRQVLDLLLSDEATEILRRLAQVERLRQTVLGARARSKALAALDYLTQFDRHAKHSDCDLRRRVREAILKQTSPSKPDRRPPSAPRSPQQLPDLVRLRAARVAAEQHRDAQSENCDPATGPSPVHISVASISPPHPSPLFESPPQRATLRRSFSLLSQPQTAAKTVSRSNSASCCSYAQSVGSCKCGSPDDG